MRFLYNFPGIVGSSGEFWKHTRTFSLNSLRDFGFGRRSLEGKVLEEVEHYLQVMIIMFYLFIINIT